MDAGFFLIKIFKKIKKNLRKFYQRVDGPYLDLGGFAMALKYASDCKHVVIGKPEHDFFMNAINDMGLKKEEVFFLLIKYKLLLLNFCF